MSEKVPEKASTPGVVTGNDNTEYTMPWRLNKEMLFEEMENKLRILVTSLMSPLLKEASFRAQDFQEMRTQIENLNKKINRMSAMQNKVVEAQEVMKQFREDVAKCEVNVAGVISRVDEDNLKIHRKLDSVGWSLGQKESAILHMQRCLDRVVAEVALITGRLKNSPEAKLQVMLDDHRKHTSEQVYELEARLRGMELEHNSLTDTLWGTETGLAKVTGDVARLNEELSKLAEEVIALGDAKDRPEEREALRLKVCSLVSQAEHDMSNLSIEVGKVVNDVKEHLRTAIETVSSHNVTFCNEVRSVYKHEQEELNRLRTEVEDFVSNTECSLAEANSRISETSDLALSKLEETNEAIVLFDRRVRAEHANARIEHKDIEKRISGVFDNSSSILLGLEHIAEIVDHLVDAAKMQYELECQDSKDRNSIHLLGIREQGPQPPYVPQAPPPPPPGALASPTNPAATARLPAMASPRKTKSSLKSDTSGQNQVVNVDRRCLSCSGSATSIISAFKMACLQYRPAPVQYAGKEYNRFELLDRSNALLIEARRKYELGRTYFCIKGTSEQLERSEYDEDSSDRMQLLQHSVGHSASVLIEYAGFSALPPLAEKPSGGRELKTAHISPSMYQK